MHRAALRLHTQDTSGTINVHAGRVDMHTGRMLTELQVQGREGGREGGRCREHECEHECE